MDIDPISGHRMRGPHFGIDNRQLSAHNDNVRLAVDNVTGPYLFGPRRQDRLPCYESHFANEIASDDGLARKLKGKEAKGPARRIVWLQLKKEENFLGKRVRRRVTRRHATSAGHHAVFTLRNVAGAKQSKCETCSSLVFFALLQLTIWGRLIR